MTTLKIKVTKEILERSKSCSSDAGMNCAIALAIRDIFPNSWVNSVDIELYFTEGKQAGFSLYPDYIIELPWDATKFINKFDTTPQELRPNLPEQEFEISIPDEVIDRIDIDEVKKLLINHPTLELV